jgi:two-component system CheB/CheR fusion protein
MWFEFTGGKKENEKEIRKSWDKCIHPDDREKYHEKFDSAFELQQAISIEYRLWRKDGEYRWVMDTGKPNYSHQAEFLGYIGTTSELHDRKMMMMELDKQVKERTQELKSINSELHRSNSELQQFAYVASHDLQEPLRKILTYIDRIKHSKEKLSENGNRYFQKITESSKRMTRLIDDLLSFSSISFSTRKFIKVDLNTILKDVLIDFDLIIAEKKAEITFEKNFLVIDAEPLQMAQLFHNLISNALKFARENVPAKVSITQRKLSDDGWRKHPALEGSGPYVELIFADNGIGFDPQFADQIFVIFQRLNEKRKYPGTGIGLALCKRIVTNHNGHIYAESLKEGAAFHVILPIDQY